MAVVVSEVEPSRTYPLRHKVLRPHESLEQMSLFDDDDPDSATFAAVEPDTEEVVGTATVRRAPAPVPLIEELPPASAHRRPWRLRGMATREDLRGQGIGAKVLDACLGHVASRGGGLLWCNARVGARSFYGRAGFSEFGEEFEEGRLGPHVVMWRVVEPADPAGISSPTTRAVAGSAGE
jgi:GNAT superfamily N-acetyltransferase